MNETLQLTINLHKFERLGQLEAGSNECWRAKFKQFDTSVEYRRNI